MKKRYLIWAATAALFVVVAAVIWFVPKFSTNHNPITRPIPTAIQATPAPTSGHSAAPESEPTATPTVQPTSTPKPTADTPEKKTGEAFKLKIDGRTISVAYGVDEKTLDKTPGWLTTSVMPGEEGMCVVYGHRNRTHLRVLEKVKIGDAITVTMQDGTIYTYTVSDIQIYERTEDFKLPITDGRTLVVATCYPFRYSGHAPGKCIVITEQRHE